MFEFLANYKGKIFVNGEPISKADVGLLETMYGENIELCLRPCDNTYYRVILKNWVVMPNTYNFEHKQEPPPVTLLYGRVIGEDLMSYKMHLETYEGKQWEGWIPKNGIEKMEECGL